jgi:conserved oligomeric Golgi complex subunit 1
MATTNLINLDVDQIFEQHTVSEVEVVNRKIQAEIELKREELRTMVCFVFCCYSRDFRQIPQ